MSLISTMNIFNENNASVHLIPSDPNATFYILPNGIGKDRRTIFSNAIQHFHLQLAASPENARFILADEQFDLPKVFSILKLDLSESQEKSLPIVIQIKWLSDSLKEKHLVPLTRDYIFRTPLIRKKAMPSFSQEPVIEENKTIRNKPKRRLSDDQPQGGCATQVKQRRYSSDDDNNDVMEDYNDTVKNPFKNGELPKGNWMCSMSSQTAKKNTEINKDIIDKLQAMADLYDKTNDKWRAYSYQKAITTIRRCTKRIDSYEEIIKLPGIGESLAKKIWEIIDTGSFEKLEDFQSSEYMTVINLFGNIWGCGPNIAKHWYDQGFRTLDDVRTKAKLSQNQTVGLKYYDEFRERIPRDEVAEIETVVKEHALALVPGLTIQTCGSYRRGKATCGDVDILITHTDGISHQGLLIPIVDSLRKCGFLTDDLVLSDKYEEDSGSHVKYFGVCLLPGENRKHRRLDIIVIPYDEYACALLYFTGSALFNRSMRNLAHQYNMYLSQHRLNTGVIRRNNSKINMGTPLYTPTEESIFKYLNLPYRPPEERDH
ncbi:unnamed protein product [Rotaria magnacalcarata]|uniref:DNA polymerase n=2 Tax=Rotaria magnacalcarata TaxID=392030 RepID=A0A816MI08_9BILA|nr:unnamed protein product [Rotaria magnacalcarata]CAF1590317.1 unnamed protein product [Rotaria magnacalcarata]CAF1995114.1 unnamed protein product [Rotaria magnacalcarata]CAF3814458.1 unnamed protein product [Rotaria magnacalcarata]CAF3978831.1 unnamed protein product [Rotaria magnacalcarata]